MSIRNLLSNHNYTYTKNKNNLIIQRISQMNDVCIRICLEILFGS